jgi:hypothetical protein
MVAIDLLLETDFGKSQCLECGEPLYGPFLSHFNNRMDCGCEQGAHGVSVTDTMNFHFSSSASQG